ncbi:MAG: hypothetical protein HY015_02300 [Bacteroidetes bacterium]|nr:hypothetical protein [Bacteroidota bacterium]MBI3481802.1 hypothetical protein [Bacteroidota bacterium]
MKLKPNYIEGIFNYCDRWCERCTFTSRCNVYENTSDLTPEQLDIHNKAFWENIANNFKEAMQMLRQKAEEFGIDPNDPELSKGFDNREKTKKEIKKHPLAKLSWNYGSEVFEWMKKTEAIKEKGNEVIRDVELGIVNERQAEKEVASLQDCFEIIQWYEHFIHVKVMRALMGKAEDDGWERENGFQRDFDGSAKIAAIAIDRSLQAWAVLHNLFPQNEDEILNWMATLQKMKSIVRAEFPEAEKFIRPGFDEPEKYP